MSAGNIWELCEAATPGPWIVCSTPLTALEQSAPLLLAIQNPNKYPDVCRFLDKEPHAEANAELISRLSPDAVLAVVEYISECATDDLERISPGMKKKAADLLDKLNRPKP